MKNWQQINHNHQLKQNLLKRELLYDTIRQFFKGQNFHEVETPLLVNTPSCESNLEVFETKLLLSHGYQSRAFLTSSPEYAMKKLIASGIGSCFQITKSFRNQEAASIAHNPEFSILEWYRVGANYHQVMVDFEQLFVNLMKAIRGNEVLLNHFIYQDQTFDVTPPWPRYKITDVFYQYAQINPDTLLDPIKLAQHAQRLGYTVEKDSTWEQVFYQIYFNQIEPELIRQGKPYFLYEYPLAQASLAKKAEDSRFAERFEVFLGTLELGNCFSELTEPVEQELRLIADLKERHRLGKTEYPLDEDFIQALKNGLPETAGIAVGLDRLLMLLLDVSSVGETLFFPLQDLFDLE